MPQKMSKCSLVNDWYKLGHRLSIAAKCMTLNDICVRYKVIVSLNAAIMAEYSLVMTLMPCR